MKDVYTIEIVEPLGKRAARTLKKLGYKNVFVKVGDGYLGWPEAAPFDKIIVTCSPEKVPQPLVDQLRDGGLMIVPVGERYQQNLYLFRKHGDQLESEALKATLFVPMTGEAEAKREVLPDPLHPKIANGSFEDTLDDSKKDNAESKGAEPAGWHYQRQLTLENDPASALTADSSSRSRTRNPASPPTRCKASPSMAGRSPNCGSTMRSAARTSAPARSQPNGR